MPTLAADPTDTVAPLAAQAPTLPAQQSLTQPLNAVLDSTPELSSDPGTAVSVAASGGNVVLKGQAVAQAGKRTAAATAADQVKSSGGIFGDIGHFFSDVGHDAEGFLGKVAKVANVGLETVQQEYRYLHDVEARHGIGAAIAEGVGILAGATIGTVIEPGEGTVLGSEVAARIEGAVAYKDSWRRAANPNYRDPHTGQLVSFGRDVASFLGLGGAAKTLVSGALDGLADLYADPLGQVGKGLAAAHDTEGMGGLLGRRFTGIGMTPEQVDQGYRTLPSIRRAFDDIGTAKDAAEIMVKYPQFAGIARTLATADNGEDVRDIFMDLTGSAEMMKAAGMPSDIDSIKLPTRGLLRGPGYALRTAARNAGEGEGLAARLANNKIFGARTWADRFEAQAGSSFDRASMDISGTQINPADDNGALDVYRMMRYGLSDRASKAVAEAYLNGTVAERRTVLKNGIMKMLLTRAHVPIPADIADRALQEENPAMEHYIEELADVRTKNAILKRLNTHLEYVTTEGAPPNTSVYGVEKGELVPGVTDGNGVEHQAAIRKNQAGKLSLPNFHEAKRMAQAIRQSKTSRFLTGADDFLYDHVTQGFFKPLVLLSGGYALHISFAEVIPNTLRHGLGSAVANSYRQAIASLAYHHDTTEEKGFLSWLYDVAGRRALEHSDQAQDLAKMYAVLGYRRTLAAGAAHVTSGETEPVEKAIAGLREEAARTKLGDKFATMDSSDPDFIRSWQASLSEAAKDPWTQTAAKAYRQSLAAGRTEAEATEDARQEVLIALGDEPQNVLDNYEREMYPMKGSPAGWTPRDGHAAAIVAALKGDIHGAEDAEGNSGPLNMDLLNSIIHQRTIPRQELEDLPIANRPSLVKGRTIVPDGTGTVQRIANVGFEHVINPMVNMISRNREFANEFLDAYGVQKKLVEAGLKSDDQAMNDALSQATTHMMRFVHNLKDRTQWTDTMRNWVPFFFAQEQAYRRMGRFLAEDPGGFRRYQMLIGYVAGYTNNLQDSNGNRYIAFPGSGFLGKGVADAMGMHGLSVAGISPASFGGSFSSANVIFPMSTGFRPDLGPVAALPLSQLSTMFTELGKDYASFRPVANVAASALSDAVGSETMSQPIWEQLIPNAFASNLIEAFAGNSRAFNSSVMQAYQLADYEQAEAEAKWRKDGSKGEAPQIIPAANASAEVKQNFVNKIRNMVRALYLTRAMVAMWSPVSADVEIQNFNFPAELQDSITKAGSVDTGMQNFLLAHPEAVPYTVAQSYVPSDADQSSTSGFSLSSSVPAMNWVEQNQTLVNDYGNAAMWLMPQLKDNKYDPSVYNQQIAQGLRVKDTPAQFLTALYTAAGDNQYYAGLTIHENALASMGQDSTAKDAEYNSWNQWVTLLQKQNPVWADQHFSADRQTNAQQVIEGLTQIFNSGEAPVGDQSDDVLFLLQQYQLAAANYTQVGSTGSSYSNQQYAQSQVNDNWIKYLDTLETARPNLKPIIQTIFKGALTVTT